MKQTTWKDSLELEHSRTGGYFKYWLVPFIQETLDSQKSLLKRKELDHEWDIGYKGGADDERKSVTRKLNQWIKENKRNKVFGIENGTGVTLKQFIDASDLSAFIKEL